MSSIFAWNMRGFNQPRKQKAIRYWVKAVKLSIGCLLVTRVQEDSWSCLHKYSKSLTIDWEEFGYVGRTRWRFVRFLLMITVWVRNKASGDTFICSFIYASNCMIERRELWIELEISGRSNKLKVISMLPSQLFSISQLRETAMDRNSIREFQNAVHNCDMMDLAQVGPSFTWSNCQDANLISKNLDRVMVNTCWINEFPNSFATFKSGGITCACIFSLELLLRGIQNHFTTHPQYLEVVANVWNESDLMFHSRSALKMFQEKDKALKSEMRA
ncbi:LOW QUALITY PROTEIN: hypothetical protein HID58_048995 [Brassica napus]|uniref:Uncharacterized protein n=1 Tax=Brassica napus TaxID=3708 RepID=A0ABQ8B3Q8_BRANA|nr:LOW QUALITY PROTEIN: hypothetical protein HID58_048995 [Brassica napus]